MANIINANCGLLHLRGKFTKTQSSYTYEKQHPKIIIFPKRGSSGIFAKIYPNGVKVSLISSAFISFNIVMDSTILSIGGGSIALLRNS